MSFLSFSLIILGQYFDFVLLLLLVRVRDLRNKVIYLLRVTYPTPLISFFFSPKLIYWRVKILKFLIVITVIWSQCFKDTDLFSLPPNAPLLPGDVPIFIVAMPIMCVYQLLKEI